MAPDRQRGRWCLEPARPRDAEQIFAVQLAGWLAAHTNAELGFTADGVRTRLAGVGGLGVPAQLDKWRAAAVDPDKSLFVARSDGQVVGFSVSRVVDGKRRVSGLYVHPEAWGAGFGGRLLAAAIIAVEQRDADDEHIYLNVASFNTRAIAFYERHGFTTIGDAEPDTYVGEGGGPQPLLEMRR